MQCLQSAPLNKASELIFFLLAISSVVGISGIYLVFKDLGLVPKSVSYKTALHAQMGLCLGHLCLVLHDGSVKAPLPKRMDQLGKGQRTSSMCWLIFCTNPSQLAGTAGNESRNALWGNNFISTFKVIVSKAREWKFGTEGAQCGLLIRSCWPRDAEMQTAMANAPAGVPHACWAAVRSPIPSSVSAMARSVPIPALSLRWQGWCWGQHDTLLRSDLLPVLLLWWKRANGRAVSALPTATSWCLSAAGRMCSARWQFGQEVVAHYMPDGFNQ